jgi:hypothetical protein
VLVFWGARRAFPQDLAVARWAAVLAAANPIVLYYGVDGQTHSAEAAMAAALLVLLVDPERRTDPGRAAWFGVLLALGGAFRPTYALVAVAPVAWSLRFNLRALLVTGAVAGTVTLAWLLPTAALSGGWEAYQRTTDALVGEFVRLISPLSDTHDERYVALNLRNVLTWSPLALGPALIGLALRLASARALPRPQRTLAMLFALTVTPATAFYLLAMCAEAGYLAGLVPIAALTAAAACAGDRRLRYVPPILVAVELAYFFIGPQTVFRSMMQPNTNEIFLRQLIIRTLDERIHEGTVPGERILVVSDSPDTHLRQFPVLYPGLDILFLHSKRRFALGRKTTLSLATRHGWRWVRRDVEDAPASATTIRTAHDYDWIVVDPRSSPTFYAELAAQTDCAIVPSDDRMTAAHVRPSCFPKRSLRLSEERYDFEWGRADPGS